MSWLFDTVLRIRKTMSEYYDELSRNEALTRYAIIDPILRSLEWDTEDPGIVVPEEKQEEGRPDYILYIDRKPVIAIEAKKLGYNVDSADIFYLGFKYSYGRGIPFFILTNGAKWKIYDVFEKDPDKRLVLEIDILGETIEDVVRKLIALWRPLVVKGVIEPVNLERPREPERTRISAETISGYRRSTPKRGTIIDYDKAFQYYNSLNRGEKTLLEIVYRAWENGENLTKDGVLRRMAEKGVVINRRQFTGLKSGLTRKAYRFNLPPPLPTRKELGEEYRDEVKRYRLKDEWGIVLRMILGTLKSRK